MPALPSELAWLVIGLLPTSPTVVWSVKGERAMLLGLDTERAPQELVGHSGGISCAQFLSDGRRLVTAGADGRAILRDALSGTVMRSQSLLPDGFRIRDLRAFPDGNRVAALGSESSGAIWNVRTGAFRRLELPGSVAHQTLRILPGGGRLATGVSIVDGDPVRIWDLEGGLALHALHTPIGAVEAMEVAGPNRVVAISVKGGIQGGIAVWSAHTGLYEWFVRTPLESFSGLAVCSRGVIVSTNGEIRHWVWRTGELTARLQTGWRAPFALLPNGRDLFVVTSVNAGLWSLDSQRILRIVASGPVPGHEITEVAVSPGGRLATACGSSPVLPGARDVLNVAAVWDIASGRVVHSFAERSGGPMRRCRMVVGPSVSMAEVL